MSDGIRTAVFAVFVVFGGVMGMASTLAHIQSECDRHGSVQLDGKRYECKRARTQEGGE